VPTAELVLTGNDVTRRGNPAADDGDIRLRQRFETTPTGGTGNSTNNTLGVGFFNNPASIQVIKLVNGWDAGSAIEPHVRAAA
jgi:hypothetical protein